MFPSSLGKPSTATAHPDNAPRTDEPRPRPSSHDWFALIEHGSLPEIELALTAHPDLVACRDQHDMTALARAIERHHDVLAECLVRHGAGVSPPIRSTAAASLARLVRSFSAFARINACPSEEAVQSIAEWQEAAPLTGCDEMSLAVSGRKQDLIAALVAQAGPSVLAVRDGMGHTALTRAIQDACSVHPGHHSHALVEHLLSLGADAAMPDARHRTPLMQAAWAGDEVLVGMLIRHGASFGPPDPDGGTPLSLAALAGHDPLLPLLLDAMRGDPRMAEAERRNQVADALQAATSASELACVRKLLELAPAEIDDEAAGAALRMACQVAGGEPLSLLLLDRCVGSLEALRHALHAGQPEAASRLLARGFANDASAQVVCELLDAAAQSRSLSVFGLAWRHLGAKIRRDRSSRGRALAMASAIGSLDVVKDLVKARAAVGRAHGGGDPPLIQACAAGHLDVARFLADNGADVDQDSRRGVALVVAAGHGHAGVVDWLMDRGASLQRADPSGTGLPIVVAAAVTAAQRGRIDALRVLLAKAPPATPFAEVLNAAAACGNAEAIDLLLRHGIAIDAVDAHGWTPLCAAAAAGCMYGARLLVERGADPAIGSPRVPSPLACAAASDNEALVDFLLSRCTGPGQALADALVAAGDVRAVQRLLSRGAGARAHTQAVEAALRRACDRSDASAVACLLESEAGRALSSTSLAALGGWARLGMMAGMVTREAHAAISGHLRAHAGWRELL